jgi:hypothetical protein
MIGHRSFPHRRLEPLHITHRPLLDALAVTVGSESCWIPVSLSMLCSHVFENGLTVWCWENVNLVQVRFD